MKTKALNIFAMLFQEKNTAKSPRKVYKKSKLRLQNVYASSDHSENNIHDNPVSEFDLQAVESVPNVIVKSKILKATILDDIKRKSDDFNVQEVIPKIDVVILNENENK